VPRSVVMGLDKIEQRWSYLGGGIAMVLMLLLSPHLFKNTWVTDTAKATGAKHCAALYHYNTLTALCQRTHLTHPSDWLPQFLEILIVGLCLIVFAWRRKRAGVAFAGLFLGLALGTVGLPFLFLGGWLVIRALRLQKYGDASFSGSSRQAREMAQERRQGRSTTARSPKKAKGSKTALPALPAPPAPSKRYTPKQRTRRR
jgi:hypothetical protein